MVRVNGCIENGKVIEDLDTIEADVDQWKCGLCSFLNSDNIEICRLCNNVKSKFSDNRNNQGEEEEGEYIEGGEAVEKILEGVADLAERQEEGEGRFAVYGIEGEEGAFVGLKKLIFKFGEGEIEENSKIITSLLRILKSNFTRLSPTLLPPLPTPLKTSLKATLLKLIRSPSPTSTSAAQSLVSSLEHLYTPAASTSLVKNITSEHCKKPYPEGSGLHALLMCLLKRYGSGCNRLIGNSLTRTSLTLFKSILEVVTLETCNILSSKSQNWSVAHAGTQFVKAYILRLIKDLKDKENPSSQTEENFRDASVLVLRSACIVTEKAKHAGLISPSNWIITSGLLKKSFIDTLLPMINLSISIHSSQLYLATPTLPYVVNLARNLDGLNQFEKEKCEESVRVLGEWERRGLMGMGGKEGGMEEEVKAYFSATHKSSDVKITGNTMRSVSSTNQHCCVESPSSTGCKSGRAYWEFKLISDSDLDECSAIGVANLPVNSSSYESSTNMWVRRSYNGQLYHGTSAGYDCIGKVHPGDVVGVEVDMDRGELRFWRNGEDEGVCFKDLQGEIFPIICTYRSGIEVQLIRCTMSEASFRAPQASLGFNNALGLIDVGGVGNIVEDGCSFVHKEKDAEDSFITAVTERPFKISSHKWNVVVKSLKEASGCVAGIISKPVNTTIARTPAHDDIWGGGGASCVGMATHEIGIKGDGSVYIDGEKGGFKNNERLAGWKAGDVVNFRLDLSDLTLEVGVNDGSKIAVEADAWFASNPNSQFHPSVSVKNFNDYVVLEPAGVGSTTVDIYWLLDLEKSFSHVGGKLASTLVSGPSISIEEMEHENWLRSPMIIGGLESNEEVSENWMVDVAEETGAGMSVLLGETERLKERTGTLLGDVIDFTTGEQVRNWVDDDIDMSEIALPPKPDLIIRDRILDEIAKAPRSQIGEKFYEWMESKVGEPGFLKKRLDSNGCYSFPSCEQPFLAALLKHSGLWREVMWLISSGSSGDATSHPEPSQPMHFLFSKIKTMRSFLRRKRQMCLSEGEGKRFEEMCWGVRERGEFLRGTKVAEHEQIKRTQQQNQPEYLPSLLPPRMSNLDGAPSTPKLPSPIKLYRVRSTPIRPTLGVGDVQLDDDVSLKVMKSCGAYVIVDMTVAQKEEEKKEEEEKDDNNNGARAKPKIPTPPPTPLQLSVLLARRKLRALCRAYGFRGLRELMSGVNFGCDIDAIVHLKEGMKGTVGGRLKKRAEPKKGEEGITSRGARLHDGHPDLEANDNNEEGNEDAVPRNEPQQERTTTTSPNNPNNNTSDDPNPDTNQPTPRFHYLRGLESCPEPYLLLTTTNFTLLYSLIIKALKRSLTNGRVGESVVVIERLGIDWEPRDHGKIVHWDIIDTITSQISITRVLENFKSGAVAPGLTSSDVIRRGLVNGEISIRGVVSIIKDAAKGMDCFKNLSAAFLPTDVPSALKFFHTMSIQIKAELAKEERNREEWRRRGGERSRKEDRKRKGVKWTYVVTANNGVGVRSLPHSGTTRTGKSYKCDEIASVTYRLPLPSSGNTSNYLRLLGGGWLFDIGIRNPYKGKIIVREVGGGGEWEEFWRERESSEVGGWQVEEKDDDSDDSGSLVSSSSGNLYLAHKGATVVHRNTASCVVYGTRMMEAGEEGSNYFEICVRCSGTKEKVGLGFKIVKVEGGDDEDDEDIVDGGDASRSEVFSVGGRENWVGMRLHNGKVFAFSKEVAMRDGEGVAEEDEESVLETTVEGGAEALSMSVKEDRTGMPSPAEISSMEEWRETLIGRSGEAEDEDGMDAMEKKDVDIIYGCGVEFSTGKVFFTKNGKKVRTVSTRKCALKGLKLVPMCSFGGQHEVVEIHYGSYGFKYEGVEVRVAPPAQALGERRAKQEAEDKDRAKKAHEEGMKGWGVVEEEEEGGGGEGEKMKSPEKMKARGEDSLSIPQLLSIPQFSTVSGKAWDLFKQITKLSLLASSSDQKVLSEVDDKVDAICIVENRRSRSESLYGTEVDATKDYTVKLQNTCLSFLLSDLSSATGYLVDGNSEAIKVELHVFSRLQFLSEVSEQSKACRSYISDPDFMAQLFLLLEKGSPRIQKLVLEMLGTVAPRTTCGIVDSALEDSALLVQFSSGLPDFGSGR
ncbi:hypothetical protein TL16_g00006 [Triparma laevis f. inornata]|uniref:B30.2/SPRY domain-containing protein n=1 Tax=Triparma laevis f. inornata TaxID=1714386 RepID=A0A9W7DL91_9STRA|nr:hypothetical protein TL16_g00006 [Triparma laevis f. inornata]